MTKKNVFALLLCAAMLLTTVGCGGSGDTGDAVDADGYKDTLTLAIIRDPTLDPLQTGMPYDLNVSRQVYDPIFREGENGEVLPALAESYEMIDDTHIQLNLRKGVKFHDGSDFTAKDIQYYLDSIATNASASSRFSCYDPENCEIVDDHTIIVALKYAYAESVFLMSRMYIGSSTAIEKNGYDSFTSNPIGTGPFKMARYDIGTEILMDRFDEYWDGPAASEHLLFRIIPDASSRMIELETGGVDVAYNISTSDYKRLHETEGLTTVEGMSSSFTSLTFNMQDPLFADPDVRYALCYAIDKQALIDACYGGYYYPMDTMYPEMLFGAEHVGTVPYDPELAKELMVKAGYPDGFDITLHVVLDAEKRVCEAIQSMWLETLNVRAEIKQMGYIDYEAAGNTYQAAVRTGAATNLTSALVIWKSSFGRTLQPNDAYLEGLVEASDCEPDPVKRLEIVKELQHYIFEQRYQMTIAAAPMVYGMSDKVEGFPFELFGAPYLATARVRA